MVTQVTKHDRGMTYVTITYSCDIEKNVEDSRIDNII